MEVLMNYITTVKSWQDSGLKGPVGLVLARLDNVAVLASGWSARCPAHDDNLNSLSVAEGDDGRALLFCHAGCDFRDVVDALGLRIRDLFAQKRGRR
jgi:hypothetical protein